MPPWGNRLVPALPEASNGFNETSPLKLLLQIHFSSGAILPKLDVDDVYKAPKELPEYQDSEWMSRSSQYLKYLETLEYVVKEKITEVVYGMDSYNRIVDVFERRYPQVYSYRIIRPIPGFLRSASSNE